jgi:hypothetical protein
MRTRPNLSDFEHSHVTNFACSFGSEMAVKLGHVVMGDRCAGTFSSVSPLVRQVTLGSPDRQVSSPFVNATLSSEDAADSLA